MRGQRTDRTATVIIAGHATDPRTEHETLRFCVGLADRYAGEPMLSALLGTYASRLGDRAAALDLFEKGYGDFVVEPYTITLEYSPTVFPNRIPQPATGRPVHANLAGFLTSCLYGLTGLRLHDGEPSCWFERPVVLPEGWDAIDVDRLWMRRSRYGLRAEHGADRAYLRQPDH
jgi:protein-glucosylgalactosylhydroxylysine glucosidase